MDKIQELHHDKVKCLTGIIKTDVLASDAATITEDMMGRFAEWASTNGYKYYNGSKIWIHEKSGVIDPKTGVITGGTTTELIQLFKATL